jgi:hypothetical protein
MSSNYHCLGATEYVYMLFPVNIKQTSIKGLSKFCERHCRKYLHNAKNYIKFAQILFVLTENQGMLLSLQQKPEVSQWKLESRIEFSLFKLV